LIKLCLGRPRNARFLALLSDLCVCNTTPIISNQDNIAEQMLSKPEVRDLLFFSMHNYEENNVKDKILVQVNDNFEKNEI